ncbi:UDP-glycosyltransferase 73C3 [Morus notabilis]|uniref:Glycosyltransferase n=1 Tax=Morus notabilis TaxID=981085 RepID=W9R8B5_9ROSA|nr:UDP-glycosyltransferase 73C6 isoform X1 [Morus notabilis]XP_024022997.1 UDP-glycosyltransferase 73C6 isoform X2 [Morus notabilis]EXB75922.1 UDP-glycosyltransferase 73C3 [Morus notabilis]
MAYQAPLLHFLLFPLMAQGHMIPMVDIARLLAQRGAKITIVTTPHNAARFQAVLARAIESGLNINLIQLKFPSQEAGLPEGCENFDMLPSLGYSQNFFNAMCMLQQPAEKLFEELTPRPNCIISDMSLPWTLNISRKFDIPRISFHGGSCFVLLCLHNIFASKVPENISSDTEYFVVPDLPDRIEVTRAQVLGPSSPSMTSFLEKTMEAEMGSYGAIMNTFEELEPKYVKAYKKARNDKVWYIGPASLCNKDYLDKAQRGNKSVIDDHECLKWLDSWEPSSVVYVCLGSLCNLTTPQLIELGSGLEASNKPFIWVIRGGSKLKELEKWIIEDGFEERTKGRGLLIRGWSPQVLILSHPSIGGFLTHCGWNSTLEGVCAGVPMVTWPSFADQFLNEKLVVQVLKIAVSLGVENPTKWGEEETMGIEVKRETVKSAIERLMDEGEESKERRERARKLGEMSKRAVEEGGSSYLNMTLFLEEINQLGS